MVTIFQDGYCTTKQWMMVSTNNYRDELQATADCMQAISVVKTMSRETVVSWWTQVSDMFET